jgi:hypothetical protein
MRSCVRQSRGGGGRRHSPPKRPSIQPRAPAGAPNDRAWPPEVRGAFGVRGRKARRGRCSTPRRRGTAAAGNDGTQLQLSLTVAFPAAMPHRTRAGGVRVTRAGAAPRCRSDWRRDTAAAERRSRSADLRSTALNKPPGSHRGARASPRRPGTVPTTGPVRLQSPYEGSSHVQGFPRDAAMGSGFCIEYEATAAPWRLRGARDWLHRSLNHFSARY